LKFDENGKKIPLVSKEQALLNVTRARSEKISESKIFRCFCKGSLESVTVKHFPHEEITGAVRCRRCKAIFNPKTGYSITLYVRVIEN